jgi:outer membrane protein
MSFSRQDGVRRKRLWIAFGLVISLCELSTWPQSAPVSPNLPWHTVEERKYEQVAQKLAPVTLSPSSVSAYTLPDLIDFAESHSPKTRAAWESARSRSDALGVARSELFPSLVALALSQTNRQQSYFGDRYYRQTLQSFDLEFDLNYTIVDFGGRAARIGHTKEQLLAADFEFNDAHRRIIYQVEVAYYQVLNAMGQEAAAQADVANAEAVRKAAEASLKNGLATLPDLLEAKSSEARAAFDLQSAIGSEDVARGNLALALGISPTQTVPVQSIDQIANPDEMELSLDEVIDRAVKQRPDLLKQVAEIRAANARLKETNAVYFPSLRIHAYSDPHSLYGMQQQLPWGHTAALDGELDFSLNWTIFDGGSRKHNLAEARNNVRAAEAQASATRDEVDNGVWIAYSNVKTAFRQREAAEALLQAATQSYNAALESYHFGLRNILDVTEAQKALAQARSADVFARTQVLTSLADLAFQSGDSIQSTAARLQP